MIKVHHLSKQFGEQKVLKDINLTVEEGEVVCIIGPSGSGKSTFLRCINQLETPSGGTVRYNGENLVNKSYDIRKFREEVGMVFQKFNLFPLKTVLENVTLAPVLTKKGSKAEARITGMELLDRVGLAEKADEYPCTLSGGQQQRVAIARALAMHTKALLFDQNGRLLLRTDKSHRQIVNDKGWVSHDLDEIYHNTLETVKQLFHKSGINSRQIAGIGISNQRETTAVWDRDSGKPLDDAIVWQCKRAGSISQDLKKRGYAEIVREKTGIPLSPYFPAPKMSWLLQKKDNTDSSIDRTRLAGTGKLCLGTIDSWLIYKLTNDHVFRTDYSNASRTQLFNIHSLKWDEELCRIFGVPMICLPEVCGSDEIFGYTRMGGAISPAFTRSKRDPATYQRHIHSRGIR